MREKLAAVALLLCGGAAAQSPAQPAAQASLCYTVELEGLREAAHRLELRAPGWRLLALGRGTGLDAEYLALGLDCPWAAVGPLAPRGLLRVLADPLGYSPGSGVFSEPSGFRLEGALQGASRRGLWLEPLPGRLGLFATCRPTDSAVLRGTALLGGEPPGPLQAGVTATIRRQASEAARAELQALAMLSRPGADSAGGPDAAGSSSEWFHGRPPFPGGSLLHLAGSLRLATDEDRLACCLLGAASGGQRVAPGLIGLCRLEARGLAWNLTGLLGAGTEGYRLPEGDPYPGAWQAGLRWEVLPRPALRLAGSWQRRVDRPPAAPEGRLPGTEQGELSARLTAPFGAKSLLEARAEAGARVKYAADGGAEASAAGELGLGLRGNPGRVELELHGNWKGEGIELRGQLSGERQGICLRVGAAVQPVAAMPAAGCTASGTRWRPFGRLELSGRRYLFWLSAGNGDAGREVSLGWSAVQPLPKSPTVRISRCRR